MMLSGAGACWVDGERTPASVDLLSQVGEEAGMEPFPEIKTRLSLEHGAAGKNVVAPMVGRWWAPMVGEAQEKRLLRDQELPLREARRFPLALPRDAAGLTGLQCPISAFLPPPGAGLQRHGSCHNNFLLE